MGRKRQKIANNPISKHLYVALNSGDGYEKNIEKLKESGISRDVVNAWINGRRNPNMISLKKVADSLGFKLDKWYKKTKLPQGIISNEIASVCGNESKS